MAALGELATRLRAALAHLRPHELAHHAGQLHTEVVPLLTQLAQESNRWELSEAAGLLATAPDDLDEAAALYRQAISLTEAYVARQGITDTAIPPAQHTPGGGRPTPPPPSRPDTSVRPSVNISGRQVDLALVAEVERQAHRITAERVVRIGRNRERKIVWLEQGSDRAGVEHIMNSERVSHFTRAGIAEADIVDVVFQAATKGEPIGVTGKDRIVFAVTYRGQEQRIAITVSDNGFIIGANPVHKDRKWKPLS